MPTTRRSVLAAAAGLMSPAIGNATSAIAPTQAKTETTTEIARLIEQSRAGHAALMRGDIKTYQELITLSDDFTLMSPFGGKPSHGRDLTPQKMEAIGQFFKNGRFKQELVAAYPSADIVVLATIERGSVEVGGLPAQDWPLRVTLVFRRKGTQWQLAHRHADPLVTGISLEHAASLARGGMP